MKDQLLKENTIRRFMKLANVGGRADTFLEGYGAYKDDKDDEKKNLEEVEETEIEEQMDDEEPEMPEPEAGDMEMGDDMAMGDDMDMGAADISLTEEEARVLIELGDKLKGAMGDAGEEEPDAMDMGAPEDEEMGMPPAGEEEEEDPIMEEDQDEIVKEVLRRVTKRLVAQKLANK